MTTKPTKPAKKTVPKAVKPKAVKKQSPAPKGDGVLSLTLDSIAHHPATANIPHSPEESAELDALTRDVGERGVDQPIMVVPNGKFWFVVDGRHRFAAALGAGLTHIPAIVRREEEVPGIILASLVLRKHFTRGALAYISVPFLSATAEACKARQRTNLLAGIKRQEVDDADQSTLEDKCAKLGFSIDLYQQAFRLRGIFAESDDYKAQAEPKLLAGEAGLGALIAGYAGRAATKKKDKPAANYLLLDAKGRAAGLMPKAITTLENGFKQWSTLDLTARAALKKDWDQLCEIVPEDLR